MQIQSPTNTRARKYISQESVNDAYFHPKSHYLVNDYKSQSLIIDFLFAFQEIKVGLVEKKTLNSSWMPRYFVLTPVRLIYYVDQGKKQLKGCFNLASLVQYGLQVQSLFPQISLRVKVSYQGQEEEKVLITMQIVNQNVYNDWLKVLKQTVSNIKTNLLHLSIFPKIPPIAIMESHQKFGKSNTNFWNRITITPSELMNYGSHLDILFLRSKSVFSSIHRFFMRSHYDHVGVLLKDQMQKPYLLEVVNEKGVIISPLQNLLTSCWQEYEQIGYRKLISSQVVLPLERLESYVNSLIGKKYELTLSKIFIDNQTEVSEEELDSGLSQIPPKPEKTYFCSQLIADIYLKFGVLSKGKSNNFWPKDFEEESLVLSDGYSLTPLMNVDLKDDQDISAAED